MDVPETEKRFHLGYALLTAALLPALGAYVWRGWYARYITDDFCTASILRDLGFAGAMRFHREMWSGRYSYYLVKALPESIGPITARFTPGVMIVLFCAFAIWTMRQASRSAAFATAAGLAIVFAAIDGTPDVTAVGGPLIWETGVLTYMLPIALYTLWVGVLLNRGRIVPRLAATVVLMLVAGGLSETSLAAQGALTAGLFAMGWFRRQRDLRWLGGTALAATLLALVIMASAPGNVIRTSELPPRQPLGSAIVETFHLAYGYPGSVIFVNGASLLVIAVCGAVLGMESSRERIPAFLWSAAIAFACFLASILPAVWTLSKGPPPRALHVTNFAVIAGVFSLFASIGALRPVRVRRLAPFALAAVALVPVFSLAANVATMPKARAGAAEMDRIVAVLSAHRDMDVVIGSPYAIAERLLVPSPEFWTNRCICTFYGVHSLSVSRRGTKWSATVPPAGSIAPRSRSFESIPNVH